MSPKVHMSHELKETLRCKLPYGTVGILSDCSLRKHRVQPKADRKQGGEDTHINES